MTVKELRDALKDVQDDVTVLIDVFGGCTSVRIDMMTPDTVWLTLDDDGPQRIES